MDQISKPLPVMQNTNTHPSGVTSLSLHPINENLFLSGCFDEKIRLWDMRNIRDPIWSYKARDGVWRMKWINEDKYQSDCRKGFK